MKRLAPILIVALGSGCGGHWNPWAKKSKVIMPDQEFVTSLPTDEPDLTSDTIQPLPTVEPGVATTRPGVVEPTPTTATVLLPTADPGQSSVRVIPASQIVDAAMIQVNDKYITLSQVLHPIRERLQAAPDTITERDFRIKAIELVQQEMKKQIEQALILGEADRKLTQDEKDAIERQLDANYRRALAEQNGSRTSLVEQLKLEGTTLDEWTDSMRRNLRVQGYLQRHVFSRMNVSRRMLADYYKNNPDEFRTPGRLQMQIIAAPLSAYLVRGRPATQDEREQARKLAKRDIDVAEAALAQGQDLAAVARKYSKGPMASNGGVWPMMNVGTFKATFVEQTAYRQKVGATSKVLEGALGYHIVRTLALQPGRTKPFEEVQDDIRLALQRRQYESIARKYLDDLRKRAVVQMADDFEKTAINAAVARYYRK